MNSFYQCGQHVIGADVLPVVRRVQSVNTAVYAANMMASDSDPARTVGEDDPVTLLQIGDEVSVIGPQAKNSHGVAYTPVNVTGREGVYWVRSSSLGTAATRTVGRLKSMPVEAAATGWPWWKYALAIGGGAVVAGGAVWLIGRSSKASQRGHGHALSFRRA